MRVAITGSNGFVGRHFSKRLLDEGHAVVGIDDLSSGISMLKWMFKPKSIDKWTSRTKDVRDWFQQANPDAFDLIIHCAAIVGGRLKIDGDPLAVATDLSIDAEFFNWVVRAKSKPKIIYFSSSAVYPIELQTRTNNVLLGEHYVIPQHQLRIGMPDQTYGWSKLSGEVLVQHAVRDYGADVQIYRPFGGYGEDQSLDYPFPSIIKRIVDGENPVVVWGSGEQQRDFIHIDLLVDIVLNTMNDLAPGETLNLGTGMGLSFKELATIAAKELGKTVQIVNDSTKPAGVFSRVADPYKLQQIYPMPDSLTALKAGIKKVAAALAEIKSP